MHDLILKLRSHARTCDNFGFVGERSLIVSPNQYRFLCAWVGLTPPPLLPGLIQSDRAFWAARGLEYGELPDRLEVFGVIVRKPFVKF